MQPANAQCPHLQEARAIKGKKYVSSCRWRDYCLSLDSCFGAVTGSSWGAENIQDTHKETLLVPLVFPLILKLVSYQVCDVTEQSPYAYKVTIAWYVIICSYILHTNIHNMWSIYFLTLVCAHYIFWFF